MHFLTLFESEEDIEQVNLRPIYQPYIDDVLGQPPYIEENQNAA